MLVGRSGHAGSAVGAHIELRLAGTFSVVRDGAQLTDGEIGSRKSRTLLKLLAVERPGLVTVDRIVEILWPDERPASPEQNVAIMVSRLRAVLGAELIQGGRAGYRLAAGPGVVVDLDAAAGFCEQAEGKLGTAAAVALAAAERAHELLSAGTAFGDEPYADWADPAREQVRELLRRVRLAAAEASLATGDPQRAASYAEAAIAADPLDETAHRWYMSAAAAAGEQARALAAYEALRQRLGRELGADPAPQTRELHLAILREQDGGLARSGSGRAVPPGPKPGPIPLAGRDRESMVLRVLGLLLVAAASLATAWSAGRLVYELATGHGGRSAVPLLINGGAIWLTNVIVFALWYWEFDRGGPAARASARKKLPDFVFTQMTAPELASRDWEPAFLDYLYLSFTNATAFSPTDTLPLSRWAKLTMMFQSGISLVTVALVVARAVNIFT